MSDKKNIVGFKKFSDMKKTKVEDSDLSSGLAPYTDSDLPMNPNLPKESDKIEKTASIKNLIPKEQSIELSNDDELDTLGEEDGEETNEKVETFGKVAKFPKNIKASKAYNFLENVKVSKKSIWYIMVEKQDNELQMIKYNYKEGVDLSKFVNELKTYYVKKYSKNKEICKLVENIKVDGNDKYSMVKNIPLVEVDGKKMITKITEDLIKLLSK
jgi:hypothetical protein